MDNQTKPAMVFKLELTLGMAEGEKRHCLLKMSELLEDFLLSEQMEKMLRKAQVFPRTIDVKTVQAKHTRININWSKEG